MGRTVLVGTVLVGSEVPTVYLGNLVRERNPLAHPTLDMYLPLSKFESIH